MPGSIRTANPFAASQICCQHSLTSGGAVEEARQAVLYIIHLMTRFPPAVRAAYVLMRGETPQLPERAALAQSLYEVLKEAIPLHVIRSDPLRYFEGSRLLFGLILGKSKNFKVTDLNQDMELPYVGMEIYDLRNVITMDTVLSVPVQTKAGLLNSSFHKAFKNGGFLTWTNGNNTTKVSMFDSAWSRVAILLGGTKARIVCLNFNVINTKTRYVDRGEIYSMISPAEYSQLS
jgi:hypothetical protein